MVIPPLVFAMIDGIRHQSTINWCIPQTKHFGQFFRRPVSAKMDNYRNGLITKRKKFISPLFHRRMTQGLLPFIKPLLRPPYHSVEYKTFVCAQSGIGIHRSITNQCSIVLLAYCLMSTAFFGLYTVKMRFLLKNCAIYEKIRTPQ